MTGSAGDFVGGVVYTDVAAGDTGDLAVLLLGGTAELGAWALGAYYSTVLAAQNGEIDAFDGRESYGASLSYDLGGSVSVNSGIARTYGRGAFGAPGDANYAPAIDSITVADFGISLNF